MRPRLHRDATPRHATEYLLHGFRGRCHFVPQDDFSCFIQDAIRTGAISQIHANGELPFKNVLSTRLHSANLLHCRSPFLCALSTSIIGSVSHPVGDRPSPSDKPSPMKRAGENQRLRTTPGYFHAWWYARGAHVLSASAYSQPLFFS